MPGRNSRPSTPPRRHPRANPPTYARRPRFERLEDRSLLAVGAELVVDINSVSSASSSPNSLTSLNGTLFFGASDGITGNELWKSDGSAGGTVLVKDIRSGSADSWRPEYAANLTNVNGKLYFRANDGVTGTELWTSDGTAEGTVLVKDINAGNGGSGPWNLTNVKGTLFFTAYDDVHGQELWKSDGTADGTVLVKDIVGGSGSPSFFSYFTNVNGTLFFTVQDGVTGGELWKSDGTAEGTVLVKDINAGSGSSWPMYLTNVNGTLYFWATEPDHGRELWTSDGTAEETVMVKDIRSGPERSSWGSQMASVNGTVYFGANDGVHGFGLWKSDGTADGPVIVKSGPIPGSLINVNGVIYFSADNPEGGSTALWKSDGTADGTLLLTHFGVAYLTDVNGTLFFRANDPVQGSELWKSDGTEAGIKLVADIAVPGSSNPGPVVEAAGNLFFAAATESEGRELWKVTAPGTSSTVSNTLDAGPGSLRQAMLDANATPGVADYIAFAIPRDAPYAIDLASPLPIFVDAVTLDVPAGMVVDVGGASAFGFPDFAALTKVGGGAIVLGGGDVRVRGEALSIAAGTLRFRDAGAGLLAVGSLAISPGATLDLADGDLVVHATPATRAAVLTQITGWLTSGAAGLAWTGSGINSSAAAGDPTRLTALGVMLNDNGQGGAYYPTFSGETVDANSVLVKYTYYGDADLSGVVDGLDFVLVDNGFNAALSGWANGDFDYSGHIDGTDYALIDNAFNSALGPLAAGGPIPREALSPLPFRERVRVPSVVDLSTPELAFTDAAETLTPALSLEGRGSDELAVALGEWPDDALLSLTADEFAGAVLKRARRR